MKTVALIMAGGRGERFWPKSRRSLPKQFLSLTSDGRTMIQHTVKRIRELVRAEDIYISTNSLYYQLVREQLPEIPVENILCEPVGRNTAPCIGLAAIHIQKKYGEAVMMVLPSDHLIKYTVIYVDTLKEACRIAEEGQNLVTIGITPTYPETGYGYIKFSPEPKYEAASHAYRVDRFVEKPDLETAKVYLQSGEYLWNSGMFVWKVSSILANIEQHLPEVMAGLRKIQQVIGGTGEREILDQVFRGFPSVSVDYGIMEKAKDIYILPGTFGWDDVGSWLSMERINPTDENGNIVTGNTISIHTRNCIVFGVNKLIAAVGLQDIIIVDTEDALLVCDKGSTQDIKKVIENLKICNRNEYI